MPLDNYPTKAELLKIKKWNYFDEEAWLDYCMGLWTWGNPSMKKRRCYRFATGGWSGNESIIEAMQSNRMCWIQTWESSHRGGLFKFKLPKRLAGKHKRLTNTY